jgi:hypothetical protein
MSATVIDFARFLQDRGLLEDEVSGTIRQRARDERLQIGQVLVMNGTLRMAQVMQILDAQADQPNMRFGELAVSLGYLGTVELEEALRKQREHRRHQIDIVRKDALVPARELDAAIVGYVELLEMTATGR